MNKIGLQELIDKNLSTGGMADFTGLSRSKIRYWLRKHKLRTGLKGCLQCEKKLEGMKMKYCSKECREVYRYKNMSPEIKEKCYNSYEKQICKYKERKKLLLELRGGKCEKCGDQKTIEEIKFYNHTGIRDFPMYMNNIANFSMQKILKNFKNHKILCLNCRKTVREDGLI